MFDTRSNLLRLIENLEQDIKENPDRRQADLAALKDALAAISGSSQPTTGASMARPAPESVRVGSKKELFRSAVNQLIDIHIGRRVHRKVIIGHMRQINMFGDTKDIDRDVSKYLSMDGTFEPDGDGFWKRKPKVPNEIRPQEASPTV